MCLAVKKEFRGFLDTVRLNVVKAMVRQQYMGADHADESEIIEKLRNMKQVARGRNGILLEVALGSYLTKFLAGLQTIAGQGGSYGFDVVEAFRNGLTVT